MRLAILTIVCAFCFIQSTSHAALVIDEDFEDAVVTYSTSQAEFASGRDFFTRIGGAGGASTPSGYSISNIQGSGYFAAEDTNGGPGAPTTLTLTWDDFNISGLTGLSFSGFFAEDDDGPTSQDWDANSSVMVQYRIDNGALQDLFAIESEGGTNTVPRVDDDFNEVGEGAEITDTLTQFSRSISGTGLLLDLVLTISNLEAGDEDIAFDDIQVNGAAVPEPSAFLFGGLVCSVFGLNSARKRRVAVR